MPVTRRIFCSQAAAVFAAPGVMLSQSTHINVGAIDHDRILQGATDALAHAPMPLTSIPAPRSPGTPHDFYSEAEDYWPDPASPNGPYLQRPDEPNPAAFTAHRDALLQMSIAVPVLAAAFALTGEEHYAEHAAAHLRSWFVTPATRMTPSLVYGQLIPPPKTGRFEGLIEAVHLAEVALAISFLSSAKAMTGDELTALRKWFSSYLEWLNSSRLACLARDNKDHHASSWLLQAASIAHMNSDDNELATLRHQYKTSTIRAQIVADGYFPHEVMSSNPYRNSLLNLDMLAGVCQLVSTQFDGVWDYDLQDGPGMRSAVAYHFRYIQDRGKWPYRADASWFTALPLRRPSLLFAARAYNRPEYADLWKTLPADTTISELQRTFPIRQPFLWTTRPKPAAN